MLEWRYTHRGASGAVAVNDRLRTNQSFVLLAATLEGQGLGLMPTFLCGEALASERLKAVLPAYDFGVLGVHLVYPHRKYLSAKVRACVDFLAGWFTADPAADPWAPQRSAQAAASSRRSGS